MPRKRKSLAPSSSPRGARELIRPPSSYADWMQCIIHLHCELARLGLRENDLAPYQTKVFSELEDGLNEQALASLFDWWNYDAKRLFERGPNDGRPAKPKIELRMFITSKGNFVVEWRPVGTVHDRPGPDCDWMRWHRVDAYFGERPGNELLFIRSLGDMERAFSSAYESDADLKRRIAEWPEFLKTRPLPTLIKDLRQRRDEYDALRLTTDATLLQAAEGLVRLLKQRLEFCFDVQMINDVYTEWQEVKDSSAPLGMNRILMKWSIENVAERTRQSELTELSNLAAETGCSAETLAQTLSEAVARTDVAPNTSIYSAENRVTRDLKRAGYEITPSVTRRYIELLKRHRPELFPPSHAASSTVVPFRPPDRA